jgi:hypothetical protein
MNNAGQQVVSAGTLTLLRCQQLLTRTDATVRRRALIGLPVYRHKGNVPLCIASPWAHGYFMP